MTDSHNTLANKANMANKANNTTYMSSPKSPKCDLSKRQFAEISGSIVSSQDSRFIVSEEIVEGKYNNSFDNSDSNLINKQGRNGDGYRTPPPRKMKLDPCLLIQEKQYYNKRE